MVTEDRNVALCSFNEREGWRCMAMSKSKHKQIAVVKIGELKLLRVPTTQAVRAGLFCNPRKLI